MSPPPPEIFVQDWSAMELNMSDLFACPTSAVPHSNPSGNPHAPRALPDLNVLATISEHVSVSPSESPSTSPVLPLELHSKVAGPGPTTDKATNSAEVLTKEPQEAGVQSPPLSVASESESAVMSLSTDRYPSNALSAVSVLLWDPPSHASLHSTPLPDSPPVLPKPRPHSFSHRGSRDSLVPYPDIFDFSMYTRRLSHDSFCEGFELPLICGVRKPLAAQNAATSYKPVTIYDVVLDRDRYRNPAYTTCIPSARASSSPKRTPFTSTLNTPLDKDAVGFASAPKESDVGEAWVPWNEEPSENNISAQLRAACDELSCCEWTEEEFLKMFASSVVV
ncbi:hypothetical protein B0H10DRAFT_2209359 [Mycena sp. CBHHK59/15]|nr:hypothetical protein B0H10DRAFT_2209359 [Mycena sp. CBHHK59/15]